MTVNYGVHLAKKRKITYAGSAMDQHPSSVVAAESLVKTYTLAKNTPVPVLRGVSFDITAGEVVALVGPSGSGKSTLLNLLGAMDRPTSGKLTVAGKNLGQLSDQARAQYRTSTIGMVFQSFNLLTHLTARQNVLMPATLAGVAGEDIRRRADQLLESVGLTARAGHRPTELSGGEQQRVAIIRSLINQPTLLLADEPTGNLDQRTGQEIMTTLINLCRQHQTTLLIVTHDPAIAARASRQLHLVDGRLTTNS